MSGTKRQRMNLIADQIKECHDCDGMNEPGKTESAPGYGSVDSPVAIVGQSLCRKCMETKIPFTGGSGRYIDDALRIAGKNKGDIFITNVVHCHPVNDQPSQVEWINNCRRFLRDELTIVKPTLVIGLGDDAEDELTKLYSSKAQQLSWPFVPPRQFQPDITYLVFPEHPGSLRWKPTEDRQYWSPSLASAIRWGFDVR
ncbi:hypothetical protein MSIMFI_03768 [Mycobacterium simulans]|uniref:uracil-DNA glycosylase family protein n=1 Tax=Mycobacterium simulans TaxID=627089 RepID=UPI00174AF375|nr:uracil-DNA glycosylase family protein [Mycobacterium simulans]SON62247.1 hypothetical protein MSIMFI_03768 [Mycobacterium simulans]